MAGYTKHFGDSLDYEFFFDGFCHWLENESGEFVAIAACTSKPDGRCFKKSPEAYADGCVGGRIIEAARALLITSPDGH